MGRKERKNKESASNGEAKVVEEEPKVSENAESSSVGEAKVVEEEPKVSENEESIGEAKEPKEKTFAELGLDPRLVRALQKKNLEKPTLIQGAAIPLILEGKDVVARAKTGSGKTFAYLLPLLQKLFPPESGTLQNYEAPNAFILVPTRELCQQVYSEVMSLIELCRVPMLKVAQLTSGMSNSDLRTALAGPPHILVSTPACVHTCFSNGILLPKAVEESLSILVLDEADLLLSYGYEDDLKALTTHVPKRCQCLLMSATSSADVEKLKRLVLHNPSILNLPELGDVKDDVVPNNVQQFYISCSSRDKFVYILALLKLELVQKKVLVFTNTIDMSYRLKLFLEQFGIKSAVLNSELPQNSRLHILETFNAGLFDYLIASDDGQQQEREKTNNAVKVEQKKSRKNIKHKVDAEFGVVRGIDFKNVHTVLNFEMPATAVGYVHRIGRTGRGNNTGASVSLVAPEENAVFEEITSIMAENEGKGANFIAPFPLLTKNAVDGLRYRAEDVARSVTKIAVRESRAQDLRKEILNSEKLKAHFQDNPKDLDLLKHDKHLSKKDPAPHLRMVPEYLLDPTTQEASKIVKLARAAMGNNKSSRRPGSKGRARKSKDPLKTFSAEPSKGKPRGGTKRKGEESSDGNKRKRKQKQSAE